MAMHWVLQLDLEIGHTEEAMLRALTIRNIPFTAVKVIPFSHELIPEPDLPDVKVMTYGGVVMREVSEKGFTGTITSSTERGGPTGASISSTAARS